MSVTMETSVVVEKLCKSYGSTVAIDNITFSVKNGDIFGLIGPDGAGKTTLFRILTSLLTPDSGKALVCGLDPVADYKKLRLKIGYMPGRFSLYQDLSVEENLNFFATVFGTSLKENYYLIKDIYSQIEPFKDRPAGKLSGGMKQKLALSCALVHKPEILFLDEPTTGVDAVSRREFWQMLKRLKDYGITIVVSTPYMDEASLCDKVALMSQSKLLVEDTVDRINAQYPFPLFAVSGGKMSKMQEVLRKQTYIKSVYLFGQELHVSLKPNSGIQELQNGLSSGGFPDAKITSIVANIEDSFMMLSE